MPASECAEFDDLRAVALSQSVTWQVYLASQPVGRLTPATAALADMLIQAAASA